MKALIAAVLLTLLTPVAASTKSCTTEAAAVGGVIHAQTDCESTKSSDSDAGVPPPAQPDQASDNWVPTCPIDTATESGYQLACTIEYGCESGEAPWSLVGFQPGGWETLATECRDTSSPTITPAAVATAFRRIPLPTLRSIAQPGDKTLVNFDTIFHVEAETLRRDIRLLGQAIELTITPSRFRWTFGDGTEQVTTTPGAAYPTKALVHRYQRAHVTVNHHVEVTWTATWRVNGGPWQDVPGTVTLDGPATPLRIAEAVPLLSDPDH